MAVYFWDTSALVKRYVQELGTAWVQSLADPLAGNRLYIAQIAGVETVAAITLRARRGNTTPSDAAVAIAGFRRDFVQDYHAVQITSTLIAEAMDLAEKHSLRGYDAVQLAAVLQVNTERAAYGLPTLLFLSADNDLNAAAIAEGLAVDNPNAHPCGATDGAVAISLA